MGVVEQNRIYGRKRERKTGRLNIRMSDSELAQLSNISYEDDEPISQVIRKAIKTYVIERSKKDRDA